MNKLELSKNKIDKIINNSKYYNFPSCVKQLRRAIGITRRVMASDLKMDYMKLHYIESGNGAYVLPDDMIQKISDYFGVSFDSMKNKAQKYYPKNKEKKGE